MRFGPLVRGRLASASPAQTVRQAISSCTIHAKHVVSRHTRPHIVIMELPIEKFCWLAELGRERHSVAATCTLRQRSATG